MNKKPYSQVFDAAARDHIPDTIDLAPRIIMQIEKGKGVSVQPRLKIVLAVLTAVVIFMVLLIGWPTVVHAMQRLFGYVPGVGIVDLSVQVRKLAQPVSQTRGGLTVSVEDATLTSENTLIHIRMTGIPASAYPSDEEMLGGAARCSDFLSLRLPDGTTSEITGWIPAFPLGETTTDAEWTVAPVPDGVTSAILVIPCIMNTRPAAVPENWELPLQFVPVDPKEVFPVITPIPNVTNLSTSIQSSAPLGGIITLDRIVPLPDGDMFYGTLKWNGSSRFDDSGVDSFSLVDANGQPVPPLEGYFDQSLFPPDEGQSFIPVQFKISRPLPASGPITLTVDRVNVAILHGQDGSFVFDTGPNPQVGQHWDLDQTIRAPEFTLHLASATRLADGYGFIFQATVPGRIDIMTVSIQSDDSAFGDCLLDGENMNCKISYAHTPPSGVLTIRFTLAITLTGPWQTTFNP